MKVGIVVPHIFMQSAILPQVIFSPATLAISLTDGLKKQGTDVFLFTPGRVETKALNVTADLSNFEEELNARGDTYLDLLKKHPLTFISLARQVQAELIAKAYSMANQGELDIVHIYTNEEDIALTFAEFCRKPVVFTHHDPFNFQVKYRNVFPRYKHLNWLSLSLAQRHTMPTNTNWVGNIYHGLDPAVWRPTFKPHGNYVAYMGRIIEPKGVHLAIAAVEAYNRRAETPLTLKIAGKHYASQAKDSYWLKHIEPKLQSPRIEYVGFIKDQAAKQAYLGNAEAVLMPSVFDEPFGMVAIESLACGTPVIGLDSGALPEIITDPKVGIIITKSTSIDQTCQDLAAALAKIPTFNRQVCRQVFEDRFTVERMCDEHHQVYEKLISTK